MVYTALSWTQLDKLSFLWDPAIVIFMINLIWSSFTQVHGCYSASFSFHVLISNMRYSWVLLRGRSILFVLVNFHFKFLSHFCNFYLGFIFPWFIETQGIASLGFWCYQHVHSSDIAIPFYIKYNHQHFVHKATSDSQHSVPMVTISSFSKH